MTTLNTSPLPHIVLIGLESVGKSALFRALTGYVAGDETNYRGSTVRVRSAPLAHQAGLLVDTPGIRVKDDSVTTHLALAELNQADTILLVARGTHVNQEVGSLLAEMGAALQGRPALLAVTFADKAAPQLKTAVAHFQRTLGIPVVLVNTRHLESADHYRLYEAIRLASPLPTARPMTITGSIPLPHIPIIQPQQTLYEHPRLGPWLSLATMGLLFALPVYLAYLLAGWLEPLADRAVISPLVDLFAALETAVPWLHAILVGDYGLITLGWYSFLWAFPVVLFIGISVAITEEMGLKDRITAALDPWLRRIGLNGRDLIPVLTGFGCNVVAVFQSRSCSQCTRRACVSLIAFGSACSYQIGASLSLFNAAHRPGLFAPYLLLLFAAGALHTRLWHGALRETAVSPLSDRAFLQNPGWQGVTWRVRAVLKKFLGEAMPIFLAMCAVGAVLELVGLLDWLAQGVGPLLGLIGLPADVAPGVIFSIIRKDGLLILNQGEGALLAGLSSAQVFVLVYFSSTLTACVVTLWTVEQEMGSRAAVALAGRQAGTAVLTTLLLVLLLSAW
jgi:ferrous iron transport protein B